MLLTAKRPVDDDENERSSDDDVAGEKSLSGRDSFFGVTFGQIVRVLVGGVMVSRESMTSSAQNAS